jgi:hypothetical protein
MDIKKLAEERGLPERAVALLDSIGYQFSEEEGFGTNRIQKELGAAAEIAKRYQDPIGALRLIDDSIDGYLRRGRKGFGNGSLRELNEYEKDMVIRGWALNLHGLETRIETEFYGISVRLPVWCGWGGPAEDTSPGQENAIGHLEDG